MPAILWPLPRILQLQRGSVEIPCFCGVKALARAVSSFCLIVYCTDNAHVSYIYLLYSNTGASGNIVKPIKDILYPTFKPEECIKSDWLVNSSALVFRMLQ